jgi:protein TonB
MRGTVRVSFVVSSTGAIVSARVSDSSGDARLDQAALRMVRSARVPAPPTGIGGSSHAFAVPLSFR